MKKIIIAGIFFVILILAFLFKDRILGGSDSESLDMAVVSKECLDLKGVSSSYMQCWSDLIDDTLKERGIDSAMGLIAYMYDSDPSSSTLCHDLTHKVGIASYDLFEARKNFNVTNKTAYCSYGFYHGFMETLVVKTGDPAKAREFCQYVEEQLSETAPDVARQCYHGIGHGWANVHDIKVDKEETITKPALKLCEEVTGSDFINLSRCATGVFNAMALYYLSGEHNFRLDRNDPLKLCRDQEEKHQYACYISMNIVLHSSFGNIYSAGKFIEEIKDDQHASQAMINLSATYSLGNQDDQRFVGECRGFEKRLVIPCIQGYAFGFMENGLPQQEYVKPINLCNSEWMKTDERKGCLEYIFGYLPQWYSKDKSVSICKESGGDYTDMCLQLVNR